MAANASIGKPRHEFAIPLPPPGEELKASVKEKEPPNPCGWQKYSYFEP
jgi:hypothetical protein